MLANAFGNVERAGFNQGQDMIASLFILTVAIVALATRTHVSIIIRKDSTDMATVHEEIDTLKVEVAAIQQAPAATAFDPTALQAEIDALKAENTSLNATVAAIQADLGTPAAPAA